MDNLLAGDGGAPTKIGFELSSVAGLFSPLQWSKVSFQIQKHRDNPTQVFFHGVY